MQSTPSAAAGSMASVAFRGRSYWMVLTRTAPLAGLLHAALALLFLWVGAPVIAAGSAGFAAMWAVTHRLLRMRFNLAAVVLIWVAIPGHALMATLLLGWHSGFHYYVMVMVPVIFVSPISRGVPRYVLAMLLTGFCAVLHHHATHTVPLAGVDPEVVEWLGLFNMTCAIGLLAYLANVYFGVVGAAEAQLRTLATSDVLTGLANRRRILDVANYEIQRRRRGDGTPLSFMLGDVDHFKRINDGCGHEAGDQVLVAVAGLLRSVVREGDTVARWGGEEFIVVLPDTALDVALHVADRTRQAFECAEWPLLERPVTMTFGVSQWRNGETLAEAVARADEALYRGKHAGRNCSVPERAVTPQPNSLPSSAARR